MVIVRGKQQELDRWEPSTSTFGKLTSDEAHVWPQDYLWTMRFTLGITQGIVSAPKVLCTLQDSGKLVSGKSTLKNSQIPTTLYNAITPF